MRGRATRLAALGMAVAAGLANAGGITETVVAQQGTATTPASTRSTTAPAPQNRPQRFPVGTKVEADEHGHGRFVAAVVKRVGKHHYYVGFDGWNDFFDRWVPFERVRAREPGKVYDTPAPRPRGRNDRPNPVPPEPPAPAATAVEVDRGPATGRDGTAQTEAGDPASGAGGTTGSGTGDAKTPDTPDVPGPARDATTVVDATAAIGGFEPDPRGTTKAIRPTELRAYEQNNAKRLSFEGLLRGPEIVDLMVVTHRGSDPKAALGSWFYRVETVDLGAGKSLGTADLPGGMVPLAVSGDARRLTARAEGSGARAREVVGFFELRPAVVKPLATFAPFEAGKEVGFAVPVAEDRVLAASADGTVGVFEVRAGAKPEAANVRAVWESPVQGREASPVALSPNLKFVAVHRAGGLAVLRVSDGACVSRVENVPVGYVSWSPGGTKLAVTQGAMLSVYDLVAGGERVTRVALSLETVATHLPTMWLSDDLLVVNAGTVVAVPDGLPVWRLKLPPTGPAMGIGASLVTAISERDAKGVRTQLRATALPVDRMREVAARGTKDAFEYRPGDAVRLEVLHEDEEARKQIESHVRKWLSAEGVKVRDDAKAVVRAKVTPGPSRQQRMRNMRNGQETEVSIPSRIARLEWAVGGWTVSGTERRFEASGFVQAREGADVNAEVRKTLPSGTTFFETATLPLDTSILRAERLRPVGETTVE